MSGGSFHHLLDRGAGSNTENIDVDLTASAVVDNNANKNERILFDEGFGERGSTSGVGLEAENVALIVIFALLVLAVTMTGLVVYSLCGGRESAEAARLASGDGPGCGPSHHHQSRSWASLATVLMLTMVRLERNEARMANIEHELVI